MVNGKSPSSYTLTYTLYRSWSIDIICLTTLLIIFYTLWLGSYPIFTPDEGRYSEIAREMVATGDYTTPRMNGVAFLDKPILYYWLQASAIKLFGVTEWALRLFPALLGVLGTLMVYVCGRCLFDRRTGLLAAIVLATSLLYFGGAHYANLDLEVAVFVSCTLLCLLTGVEVQNQSRTYFLFAAYIFAALAFLTKGLIGLVFPFMIFGTWIVLLHRWAILKKIHLLAGIILFIALVLPWYTMVQMVNPKFVEYFFITQQITRYLSSTEFNSKTPIWFYVPVILLGFFPWTIFMVQAMSHAIKHAWRERSQYTKELFLLLWITIVFIFFSIPQSKTMGYILPIFPALALLVGKYLATTWDNSKQTAIYWSTINFILLGSILAIALLILRQFNWTYAAAEFANYLFIISILLIVSIILAFFLIKKKTFLPLFATLVIFSITSLLILTQSATYLNHNSIKPLVLVLKNVIRPEDEVIHYFRYYQDVPLYLGQKVTIVADWDAKNINFKDNWMRELWYGMKFQKNNDWLINDTKFWERWNSNKRVFVFMHINYFVEFKDKVKHYYHLGIYHDVVLLSNQPTIEAKNHRKTHNLLEANVKTDNTMITKISAIGYGMLSDNKI